MTRTDAAALLRAHGAGPAEAEELLAYGETPFRREPPAPALPLPDEPFAAAWAEYAAEARERGAFAVLRERLVQLRFPVRAGIGATPAYQDAVRRGVLPADDAEALALEAPERLRLTLHPTAAGRIPVLEAGTRGDFATLLRALARRNEPDPVPLSMGACMVAGYTNWDRVARLRARFEASGAAGGWAAEMGRLRERKELYQDRFVLLAPGPYSGVEAAALGLEDEAWRRASRVLRREHECVHYFTRRVLGAMRVNLLDELLADYGGIVAVAGRFRADWFLRFLGLEDAGRYREGGRLECYRGGLSDGAFAVLQALARSAAARVEEMDRSLSDGYRTMEGRARVVTALAAFPLEALARADAPARVLRRLASAGGPPGPRRRARRRALASARLAS